VIKMATLRDKRIFLMKGRNKGESMGIYTPVRLENLAYKVKVIPSAKKILQQQTQQQLVNEEDKIEVPKFAFESLQVLNKNIKNKI